ITPPSKNKIVHTKYENVDIRLDKGAEMGRFNLGSTVVMLMGENINLDDLISPDNTVRMGQALATYS
ncbi:MAG: phosphatidylserine decarboxylase, partial [Gammaproteobacteria bacterium]|nr:phosphatidylserine decarboxylase [Gammaproteobacteria bacterium]